MSNLFNSPVGTGTLFKTLFTKTDTPPPAPPPQQVTVQPPAPTVVSPDQTTPQPTPAPVAPQAPTPAPALPSISAPSAQSQPRDAMLRRISMAGGQSTILSNPSNRLGVRTGSL